MRFTLIQTWYSMCSSVFFSFSFRCIFYCLNILWTAIFSVFPLVGSGIQPLSSASDPCRSLARVIRRLFEDSTVCPWTYFCRTTTPAERSSGAGFYSNCEAKSFGNPLQSYELQQPFWGLLKSSYCTWTEICLWRAGKHTAHAAAKVKCTCTMIGTPRPNYCFQQVIIVSSNDLVSEVC